MAFKRDKRIAKDGAVTYSTRVDLPRDPVTGKRRQTCITATTVKELRRQYTAAVHAMPTGAYIKPTTATVGEYLTRWLATHARYSVRARTYRSYEQLIRLHVASALGNVPLQKLTPVALHEFYQSKLAGGRVDGKPGGLS